MEANKLKPFFIQKGSDKAINTMTAWGIYMKSMDMLHLPKVKGIASRSWNGEQGDDEYIPPLPTLQGSEFNIFDHWLLVGLRCRYVDYSEKQKERDSDDILVFTIKFKVNNPISYGLPVRGLDFSGTANGTVTVYFSDGTFKTYSNRERITHTFKEDEWNFLVASPNRLTNRDMVEEEHHRMANGATRFANRMFRAINVD